MRTNIEERACDLAVYIIENKATVRAAATQFGISKSTVHAGVTIRNGLCGWRGSSQYNMHTAKTTAVCMFFYLHFRINRPLPLPLRRDTIAVPPRPSRLIASIASHSPGRLPSPVLGESDSPEGVGLGEGGGLGEGPGSSVGGGLGEGPGSSVGGGLGKGPGSLGGGGSWTASTLLVSSSTFSPARALSILSKPLGSAFEPSI